jgi:hypothetical protein
MVGTAAPSLMPGSYRMTTPLTRGYRTKRAFA